MLILKTALIVLSLAVATERATIPMDQILAWDMPGTQKLSNLVSERLDKDGNPTKRSVSLERTLERVRFSLASQNQLNRALPGFASSGTEIQAISAAAAGLRKREPPLGGPIVAGEEIRVVFFAYSNAYRVIIESVERSDQAVEVRYRFEPQYTSESKVQFALIPLGKLPAGNYRVSMTKLPMTKKFLDAGFQPVNEAQVNHLVCRPFAFEVREPPDLQVVTNSSEASEGGVLIPLDQVWAYSMPGTRDVLELDIKNLPQPFNTLSTCKGNFHVDGTRSKAAGPSFVVQGSGQRALIAAHEKLPEKTVPKNTFPVGSEVSVVFFAGGYNAFVHLHQVERQGNTIKIYYRFALNISPQCTWHFALIPVGKLPTGKYQVEVIESPDPGFKKKHGVAIEETWAVDPVAVRKAVSTSFSFSITDKKDVVLPVSNPHK